MHDRDWGHHGDGWPWGWLMLAVLMALMAATLVWFALSLTRRAAGPPPVAPLPPPGGPRLQPEEVLAERLARGEIDPEDYRVRLAALREQRG
jgi:putative membrane protein